MRNLLLLLVLANILYFVWSWFTETPPAAGVVVVNENELGPPLEVAAATSTDAANSVGAVLGSGNSSDLAAVVGRSCVTIGPFKSNAEADGAVAAYEGEGMRTGVRSTQGQVFVGHWVQIRGIPDQAQVNEILETLRAGGLGESYPVPDDDGGYKISLGLFGEMTGAERVELQAKSLDLAADITPRMREATVFFVDLALPPGAGAKAITEKYGEEKVALRGAATCPSSR